MSGSERADRAIVMENSIRMVMKCKSRDRKKKANKQKADKFSVHRPNNLPIGIEK
jgi:hypothetical protein